MRVEFEDENLRRLYEDAEFRDPQIGPDVTRQYRKKVNMLIAANDERDLYAMRSLHFEKLAGKRAGQRSIRLNDQWRLVIRLETDTEGKLVVIIEIVDYH